jgi:hypothetical protein
MKNKLSIIITLLGIVFFFCNGFFDLSAYRLDNIYLTVSTFLFSVFNGFFIARQSSRYSEIRNNLSRFDADMSIIFRESTHLSAHEHEHITGMLRDYYTLVLKHKDWAYYYFTHKSTLIANIHASIDTYAKVSMEGIRGESIKNILRTLDDVQVARKLLVSLKEEVLPRFQKFFIYILATVLFLAILTLPSYGVVLASLLKSVYMITVISVVMLLRKFNDLSLFEGSIGEHSARDVLSIIDGDK